MAIITGTFLAYILKAGDAGDIITANYLDLPPNFRLSTVFKDSTANCVLLMFNNCLKII